MCIRDSLASNAWIFLLMLGISGISNDLRSVRDASEKGDERAMLAYDMYSNSVKKYIGQYIAVMGGVDAIVLTAGVGENLSLIHIFKAEHCEEHKALHRIALPQAVGTIMVMDLSLIHI